MMAPRYEQLFACADWNRDESRRAFLAAKAEKNPSEKAYLERRSVRLKAQAESLYVQAEDEERDDFYADLWTGPSMYACDGQAAQ